MLWKNRVRTPYGVRVDYLDGDMRASAYDDVGAIPLAEGGKAPRWQPRQRRAWKSVLLKVLPWLIPAVVVFSKLAVQMVIGVLGNLITAR
jgi:hypothetical protein